VDLFFILYLWSIFIVYEFLEINFLFFVFGIYLVEIGKKAENSAVFDMDFDPI
jgi:hypothetical protein